MRRWSYFPGIYSGAVLGACHRCQRPSLSASTGTPRAPGAGANARHAMAHLRQRGYKIVSGGRTTTDRPAHSPELTGRDTSLAADISPPTNLVFDVDCRLTSGLRFAPALHGGTGKAICLCVAGVDDARPRTAICRMRGALVNDLAAWPCRKVSSF